jgi:hypothetical protein
VNNQNHILILKLKQQPRQGMAGGLEDQTKYVTNTIKDLNANLPTLSNLSSEYVKIIDAFSGGAADLSMGLGKVVAIQESFAAGINKVVKEITFLEERNSKLNTSFGLSSKSSQLFANKLRTLSIATEISADKMFDYADALRGVTAGFIQSTKGSDQFRNKLLKSQQYMKNNLQVTDAAAEGYQFYATTLYESADQALIMQNKLAESISNATGIDQLSIQRDLTEDLGNLTADLQLQYSRIPGSIELAVLKSRALGMNLETLNTAGKNLLNIESSIGTELEYQLLSGKRLLTQDGKSLTNAYRMATVQGDANKQADLMNQFIKDQGPMLEKNLYARQKAAELLGTDEATLARSIQKQKLISKLGAESLMRLNQGDMTKVAEQLRAKGIKEADIADLLKSSDTRTTAQITNDYLKSIDEKTIKGKTIDVDAARASALKGVKGSENLITSFSGVAQGLGAATKFGEIVTGLNTPLQALAKNIPFLGDVINKAITKINKAVSINLPSTGTATTTENDALIMNDGIIKFNPADKFMQVNDSTMIAGTNIDGNKKLARAINGGGQSIDYNRLAAAIASAMQHVKVEATVKPDMLFSATKMNDRRRF